MIVLACLLLLSEGGVLAAAPSTWSPTGSMSTGREGHTATLLPDGRVLIAGGCADGCGELASAELYDPTIGAWQATGSMGVPHGFQTATLLPSGKVLDAGGSTSGFGPTVSAELYDSSTGTWHATGNMVTAQQVPVATLLATGQVLVTGGFGGGASAELYDPSSGTWQATGAMSTSRQFHTATLLRNGQVLAAGGASSSLAGAPALSSGELFTPPTSLPASPPTTTATLLAPPNAAGWERSTVTVTLTTTVASGGLPVQGLTYSITGAQTIASTTVQGSTAMIPVTAEGTTTLSYFATDQGGTQEQAKTLVVRIDKTPPTVTCQASPSTLWPPNGKLVPVQVTVSVTDPNGSGPAGFTLVSLTSNEGSIADEQQGFVVGSASTNGSLQASRAGNGSGRIYTLSYQGSDVAGNTATCTTMARVPHNQGH
jgi:hypothetical protein